MSKETYPECKRLDCFANIPINARQSSGLCTVLTECIKENCPFFKTKKEFKEGVKHEPINGSSYLH